MKKYKYKYKELDWSAFYQGQNVVLKRDGYYGFISLVWWMFKTNLKLKRHKSSLSYTLILPVKYWFR